MPSVTVRQVEKLANGRIFVRFGKNEYEFNSIEHMQNCVRHKMQAMFGDDAGLHWVAMALMIARQPNLNSPAAFNGRSVAIDPALPAWGTIV